MTVVFACRNESNAMGACMNEHYTEEKFVTYAKERGFDVAPKPPSLGSWVYSSLVGGGKS